MTIRAGSRRDYNDFSLRMSSSLSLSLKVECVCVLQKTYLGFFSLKWSPLYLWVMRVYIVWVKGKKVTLKNLQSRESRKYFVRMPYLRNTHEIDSLTQLFSFQSCASHMPFLRECFLQTFRENSSRKLFTSQSRSALISI